MTYTVGPMFMGNSPIYFWGGGGGEPNHKLLFSKMAVKKPVGVIPHGALVQWLKLPA